MFDGRKVIHWTTDRHWQTKLFDGRKVIHWTTDRHWQAKLFDGRKVIHWTTDRHWQAKLFDGRKVIRLILQRQESVYYSAFRCSLFPLSFGLKSPFTYIISLILFNQYHYPKSKKWLSVWWLIDHRLKIITHSVSSSLGTSMKTTTMTAMTKKKW